MTSPLLATKLYAPPPRPGRVARPHLIERLHAGLHRTLTLVSAPAGCGKTTLVSDWIAECERPVAWLALDAGDSDPTRFLTYLVAAVQTVAPTAGAGVVAALRSPHPPSPDAILTALLNDITLVPNAFILVLDDYHVVDARPVDQALAFLLDHRPPHLHLVIITREDPQLPLARYRVRGQMTELRASDLRFRPAEAAAFLTHTMGLDLAAPDIAALETRTEGWIAGLQLAALSLQGQQDPHSRIAAFSGSHRFVLDYLLEEVVQHQPDHIQTFLLHTSILDRMCGPLCDAVLGDSTASSHATLADLERANLFIVPLDNERRWYRYHHLFAELLRQRLQQRAATSLNAATPSIAVLHSRASQWYEINDLAIEAFQHATAAHDLDRAERLIDGAGMPLQFRGGAIPILNWLSSLPTATLNARPGLWVTYASALLMLGQVVGVEAKALAAEAALQTMALDDTTRDLIGRVASIRASLAVTQHQIEAIITQSRRALEYLHPDNLPVRASISWTLGHAYRLQGDRIAATHAYSEAAAMCEALGHTHIAMMAAIGLGRIQESDHHLDLAAETYHRALHLGGDPPPPTVCDAYLGLARIAYQRNDLDAAEQYVHQSLPLAQQIHTTDRVVNCDLFLARVKLAHSDVAGATAVLAQAKRSARQHGFVHQMPAIAAAQVRVLLHQGDLAAAAQLAQMHELPISQARVQLAHGQPSAALTRLEPVRQQAESRGWADERLKVLVLQALAHHACGAPDTALHLLAEGLAVAEPDGCIRIFVDEGPPMAELLRAAADRGIMPEYVATLLAACDVEAQQRTDPSTPHPLIEPLSVREVHILRLIAAGNSNQAIADALMISLNTVRYHTKNLYGKLGVNTRTQAVAMAQQRRII